MTWPGLHGGTSCRSHLQGGTLTMTPFIPSALSRPSERSCTKEASSLPTQPADVCPPCPGSPYPHLCSP